MRRFSADGMPATMAHIPPVQAGSVNPAPATTCHAAATVFMAAGMVRFQAAPAGLLGFFNASDYMLEIGVPALRIISLLFIFAGISIMSSGLFQGTGKSIYSMIVSILRQLAVLLPAAFLLAKLENLTYVWFSLPIAEVVGFFVTLFYMRQLMKMIREIREPQNTGQEG